MLAKLLLPVKKTEEGKTVLNGVALTVWAFGGAALFYLTLFSNNNLDATLDPEKGGINSLQEADTFNLGASPDLIDQYNQQKNQLKIGRAHV